jgi:hypothetical protein
MNPETVSAATPFILAWTDPHLLIAAQPVRAWQMTTNVRKYHLISGIIIINYNFQHCNKCLWHKEMLQMKCTPGSVNI